MLLRRKAELVYKRFNSIPGVSCRRVQGAMYAFPKIDLPPKALEEAKVHTLYTRLCFIKSADGKPSVVKHFANVCEVPKEQFAGRIDKNRHKRVR